MLVVSDSGPLHYLILVGRIDLLPMLYGKIMIPAAVHYELRHPNAPETIQRWINNLPPWAEVKTPRQIEPASASLDAGEREALSLAVEFSADLVLMDELEGRKTAAAMKLRFVGTVGIIVAAAQRRLLSKAEAVGVLRALRQTNMRITLQLIADAEALIAGV